MFFDSWVRTRFEEIIKLKYGLTEQEYKNQWPEQRIRRVISMGRAFEAITLRMPTMVARGRIGDKPGYRSPAYEDFVRVLDPFEHLMEKFGRYDPGAQFLLFILSNGKIMPGSSRAQVEKCFYDRGVDPHGLKLVDMANFLNAGTGFVGWRGAMAMEEMPPDIREKSGLSFRLKKIEDCNILSDLRYEFEGLSMTGREQAIEEEKHKRIEANHGVLMQEMLRNPLRILIEAEMQDGEILDPAVRNLVIKRTLAKLSPDFLKALFPGKDLTLMKKSLTTEYLIRAKGESEEDFVKRLETVGSTMARNKQKENEDAYTKRIDFFMDEAEKPLIILQQLEVDARQGKLDFDKIKNPAEKALAKAYFESICEVATDKAIFTRSWTDKHGRHEGTSIDYLAQKRFPFMPGQEDVPWKEWNFTKLGPKGFTRNLRDFNGARKAMGALMKLENSYGSVRHPEDYVKLIEEAWQGVREYDKDVANERMMPLYEGICRFNAGNNWRRYLPDPINWFIDELPQYFGFMKQSSAAKEVFGPHAASWRAVDLRNFLYEARVMGHITKEQEHELKKKLRCTPPQILLEYTCRVPLIGGIIMGITFLKELAAQLEDQAKQG